MILILLFQYKDGLSQHMKFLSAAGTGEPRYVEKVTNPYLTGCLKKTTYFRRIRVFRLFFS